MKHRVLSAVLILGIVALTGLPSQAFGFAFSASNFRGYAAYDKGGDVVNTFGLDPRLSYGATGKKFNVSAGVGFDFAYAPDTAPIEGMIADPLSDWKWTLTVKNLTVPGHPTPLPDFSFTRKASYSDLMAGASWISAKFDSWDIDGLLLFDYKFLTPSTGKAGLVFAGNINPCMVPNNVPDKFFCPFGSNATVNVTASPCPNQPVPEPTTLALFAVGMIGAGAMKRKMRK